MSECPPFATKAELEELKKQINNLFGESEDGSGQVDVLTAGSLSGTKTAFLLASAGTAIQQIIVKGEIGSSFVSAIASGAAKFETVKAVGANGVIEGFKQFGKGIATNTAKASTMAAAVKISATTLSLVMGLVSQILNTGLTIGTLNLIKQNTKNNEISFNSLARNYSSMMGFISQNNSSIAKANATNATNKAVIEDQKRINSDQAGELVTAQASISALQAENQRLTNLAVKANTAYADLQAQVEELEEDSTNFKEDMQLQSAELEIALVQAELSNETQDISISNLTQAIDKQQVEIDEIEKAILKINTESDTWKTELEELQRELGLDVDSVNSKTKFASSKIFLDQKQARSGGGSASASSALRGATDAQNGILDLARGIAGTPATTTPLTENDIQGRTTTFSDTLADLISQVTPGGTMTPEDLQSLRDSIKIDTEDLLAAGIAATVIPNLDILKRQTSAPAISEAAAAGVCSTTQPGGCMQTNLGDPLKNQMNNLINAGGTAFSAANYAVLSQMQPVLNAVNSTVKTIKSTTNATLGTVTHAKHGLEAMQTFADTAWKATQADKVLNLVSTTLAIHNGMMLSNNLASTIGEALNMGLQAIGIKDHEDKPIDVNSVVRGKINAMLTGILGEESRLLLTQRLAKVNRIYQTGINVLDTTRNLFDSAHSMAEIGIEHTGQIGNALRESGAVAEDAYGEMVEAVNPQNGALRKITKFRKGIDTVESFVSSAAQISGEVVEVRDNFEQLETEKRTFLEEIELDKKERLIERETTKSESTVTASILLDDFDKGDAE